MSGKFAGMDHHRHVEPFGQFVIGIVPRIVQVDGIVAGIEFESDALGFLQFRGETFQRPVQGAGTDLAAFDAGAVSHFGRQRSLFTHAREIGLPRHADSVDPFAAHFPHGDAEHDPALAPDFQQMRRGVLVSRLGGDQVKVVAFGKMKMGVDDPHEAVTVRCRPDRFRPDDRTRDIFSFPRPRSYAGAEPKARSGAP